MNFLRRLTGREKQEQEMNEELRDHIERQVATNLAEGMSPEEAHRQAVLQLGALEGVKESCREQRRGFWLETLATDVRYGVRMMLRSPGFTIVAILTLAFGIGANSALFSVVNSVLLNPLLYPQPEQLVALDESKPNFDTGSISFPNFRDWRDENRVFSSIAVFRSYSFSLTGLGGAERIQAQFISSDFFPLLGVNPVLGRSLAPGEEEVGAAPVALISAGFWKRKFGSSADVLGKSITLDGKTYYIVGVVPANFDLLVRTFRSSEVYVPMGQWTNNFLLDRAAGLGIHGVGRLKPGVTIEQARADMQRVTQNLAAAYPDADKGIGASVLPLKDAMVSRFRPALFVLLGAVGFVLLIACGNVANLLLVRSTGRAREFAIRAALGAGRGRIVRQLLTESVLLAVAGGSLGLLLAGWGTRAALGILPDALPRAGEIHVDARVLTFTLLISLLAGIFFGMVPALRIAQPNVRDRLQEGGRGASGARHRAQGVFVILETALALVLLAGAGLMIRSLKALWSVDPGFRPQNILTFLVSLPPSMMKASPESIRAALRDLDARLGSAPGVRAISLSAGANPMGWDDEILFWIAGQPKPANTADMNWTIDYLVEPDYLNAMGIPLVRGRFFTSLDNEHAPRVVVVDDVFAQRYFGNQDPIGKPIVVASIEKPAEIVGLVRHVKQWGLDSDDTQSLRVQMYLPLMQMPDDFIDMAPSGTPVVLRYEGPTSAILDSLRRISAQMNSDQVISNVQTMEEIISDSLAARRFSMITLGAFAALALLLASVGIYGVVSYVAGQRTHEIGIRMALGAQRRDVLGLVLSQGTRLALAGVALGIAAGLGLTRLLASQLYGVSAYDPLTFAGVALLLVFVALAACYIPARHAMRVDPMTALRYE
jgi:putative ABC transport system permease protein